jgi:hypothetical protein
LFVTIVSRKPDLGQKLGEQVEELDKTRLLDTPQE